MLPTPYFHVTITVPEELRAVLRANQRDGYALLMKAAAEAIIELARDPRFVGATVGVLAVLHTWTQQLLYHPHVHCLVSGGGVSQDGGHWLPARKSFLVPAKALARLVRGKLRAAFQKSRPDLIIPEAAWSKAWVVHCTAWGNGEQAVLDYLARYVFRIAITNSRIVGLDDHGVTIRYKKRKSNRWRTCRIPGEEFIRSIRVADRSCSMFCPRDCTRSATSACGTPPGAISRPERVSCSGSSARPRHIRPGRLKTPPIGRPSHQDPRSPGSARAAPPVTSSASAALARSRRWGHDPQSLSLPSTTALVLACARHATAGACLPDAPIPVRHPE